MIKVSVCIATWRRKKELKEIIMLLEKQTMNKDTYEIIVVDSSSNDGTEEMMKSLCFEYENLRYFNITENVLACKRNKGINEAKADIIIFLDDDVYPCETFIESHYKAQINSENTVYCGQVRFPKEWTKQSNYYRFRDGCHLSEENKNKNLPFKNIVVMNLSFKKTEVLNKIGYVSERFLGYGCEDTDFGYRIVKAGINMMYLNEALAYHKEKSESIEAYCSKIYKASKFGMFVLEKYNYECCKQLFNYRLEKRKIRILFESKLIYNFLIKFLDKTDRIQFLFMPMLYRYCIIYAHLKGSKDRLKEDIKKNTLENGW